MATKFTNPRVAYGLSDALPNMAPLPIIANRAPTGNDFAELGTTWVDKTADSVYVITSIVAGAAVWSTSPASGVGTFTSVDITPGDLDVQDVTSTTTISSGTINFDNAAATTTIAGAITIAGVTTINGDLDLTSASLIDLTSTLNADPSIYLHANGGVLEVIRLRADQGTAVNSIDIVSDVGGITLTSGLASADAINFAASNGGIDMDGALQVNIASSQAAATALRFVASDAAGGIDIDCGTGGIAIDSTGAFSLDGAAASNCSVSGAGIDLTLASAAGRVVVNGEEAAADAVRILSAAGGLDADVALQMSLVSSQAAADAIVINASDAVGGVQIQAGSNGILIGDQADCAVIDVGNIAPTASRTITVGGGQVATAAVADTIDIGVDAVTTEATASKVVNIATGTLDTGVVTANVASGAITSGTHTVNIQTGNAAAGTVACNISTGTGTKTVGIGNADGLTTTTILGVVDVNVNQNNNIRINSGTSTGTITMGSVNAGAVILASGSTIDIDAVGALSLNSSGAAINIGNDADNFAVNIATAGTRNVSIGAATQTLTIDGATIVETSAGAYDIDAAGALSLNSSAGVINVGNDAVNQNMNIGTAGTRTIAIGSATATNTIVGGSSINASANFNTAINSGTSTGSVTIGNAAAGAVTIDSSAGISLDAGTASNFTAATGDLSLIGTAGSVVISSAEAVIDAVQLTASAGGVQVTSDALGSTTGLHLVQGAATVAIQVGAGAPSHNAPKGSLYLRTDGSGVNDRAYIATDAVGTWTAIVTVA